MKKFTGVAMMAVVSLSLFFAGCGGSKSQAPEVVAEKYLAAYLKQDFSTMKKYASEKDLKNIAEQERKSEDVPAEKKELLNSLANAKTDVQPAVINEENPDKALVDVNYTMSMNGEDSSGIWKMKLVKEGGEWKVDNLSLK